MTYELAFGDIPPNNASKFVVELLALYFRSEELEKIAQVLGERSYQYNSQQIRYEANDLRTRVVTAFNPQLNQSCVGTLEVAIQLLPKEYHWLRKVVSHYPTHYANIHKNDLTSEQLGLLDSIAHYPIDPKNY